MDTKTVEVAVVGARMWANVEITKRALRDIKEAKQKKDTKIYLVHRGKSGGEAAATALAKAPEFDFASIVYYANQAKMGAWSNWECTERILKGNPKLLVAFVDYDDDVVWEAVRMADVMGIPVWIYDEKGRLLPPTAEELEAQSWWLEKKSTCS